jgi:adenylylsulfate kinase
MDKQRRVYFPKPRYTAKERTKAYELFAEDAASTAASGLNVIMDGSAPKLAMREYARSLVPYFAEVYIQCSLEVAMRRESQRQGGQVMADLYQKALDRQQTGRAVEGLGQVIGVDVPFEDNPLAECRVDNDLLSLQEAKEEVLRFLEPWRLALETG